LDIEWLLSTLFDASLFNFRAAGHGGSFFFCATLVHIPPYLRHPVFGSPLTIGRESRGANLPANTVERRV